MSNTGSQTKLPQSLPTVTVDAVGKANVSIPIEIPPGLIEPDLTLVYNSDSSDGMLGRGWQLSGLHAIFRDASYGVRYDANDHYISSLGGRLVKSSTNSTSSGGTSYYTKNDPFTKYLAKGSSCGNSPGICSWEVTTRDGKKYYFGGGNDSSIRAIGKSDIRVWTLYKVEDLNGNSYEISYELSEEESINNPLNGVYYPQKITYQNRIIEFEYEDKSHTFPEYGEITMVKESKRLKKIIIKHNLDGSEVEAPHGIYTFEYSNYGFTKSEFLTKVYRGEGYKPIEINYHDLINGISNGTSHNNSTIDLTYSAKAPVNRKMRGLCQDGQNACLCTAVATCLAAFPESQGVCALYEKQDHKKCTTGEGTSVINLFPADINGDGKRELFRLTGKESDNEIALKYQKVGEDNTTDIILSPYYPVRYNSFVAMGDVNGDGKDDFLFTYDKEEEVTEGGKNVKKWFHKLQVAFANQKGDGFEGYFDVGIRTGIPRLDFNKALENQATKSMQWIADVNGDGRVDFVQKLESGDPEEQKKSEEERKWFLEIYLSKGTSLGKTPGVPDLYLEVDNPLKDVLYDDGVLDYADQFTQIVDMDGDSIAEYVNIKKDTRKIEIISFNFSNSSHSKTLHELSGSESNVYLQAQDRRPGNLWLADINGDGKQDLVFLNDVFGNLTLHTYYFTGEKFRSNSEKSSISNVYVTINDLDSLSSNDEKKEAKRNNITRRKMFTDINGDGKMDFVRFDGSKMYVSCSDGKTIGGECDFSVSSKPLQFAADFNGDGRADIIGADVIDEEGEVSSTENSLSAYIFSTIYAGKLKEVKGGRRHSVEISYKLAPKPDGTESRNYPDLPNPSPDYVVETVTLFHKDTSIAGKNVYQYSKNRFLSGTIDNRRGLGFQTITKTTYFGETKLASKDIDTYYQDHDIAGNLKEKKHYVYDEYNSEILTTIQSSKYDKIVLNEADWIRNTEGTQKTFEEGSSNPLTTSTLIHTFDNAGNITKKETTTTPIDTQNLGSVKDSVETSDFNEFGMPGIIIKKSQGQVVGKTVLDYDSKNNLKIKKKLYSGTSHYVTESYTYNSNGTLNTKTDPNGVVTEYVEYDSDVNMYATKIQKSANGRTYTISKEYDTLTGRVGSETSIEGLTQHKKYDSYGRTLFIWYPGTPKGENNYNEKYIYVDTDTEKSVTRVQMDGTTSGLWYKEHFDDWERVYKKESKAMEGKSITEEFEFVNDRQLVKKSSIPYYDVKDRKWTTYEYDYLERPTTISYPDSTSKTFVYDGFKTVITSPKSTKTIEKH